MATKNTNANKKSSNKKSSNSNKTANSKSTSSGKVRNTKTRSIANTRTGKSSSNSRRKKKSSNSRTQRDIIFCIMLVLCVFVFLCLINVIKEPVGTAVKGFIIGTFGFLGYIVPLVLFLGTWFLVANRDNNIPFSKVFGSLLVIFFTGAFLSLVSKNDIDIISNGNSIIKDLYSGHCGGGVVFGSLAVLMVKFLGKAGAIILDILFLIIGICCILGKSLLDLFSGIFSSVYSKVNEVNEDDDNFYADEYYEEDDGQYNIVNKNNKKNKNNSNNKERNIQNNKNFFKNSTINTNVENTCNDTNDLNGVSNVDLEHSSLESSKDSLEENIDKPNILKGAQESIRNRLEEEQRIRKEKEIERLKVLDMKDDERILSSSRVDSNLLNTPNIAESKDDVHLINIIPEEELPDVNLINRQTSLYENKGNTNRNSKMQEIFYDGLSNNVNTHDLSELVGEINEINNSNSANIQLLNDADNDNDLVDNIRIKRYFPDNTNDEQVQTKMVSDDTCDQNELNNELNNESNISYVSQNIKNNILTDDVSKVNSSLKQEEDVNVLRINDTPMDIPESIIKGISINPLEDVYGNDPELSTMPNPVTERSHIKEPVKQEKQIRKIIHDRNKYIFPNINLLTKNEKNTSGDSDRELKETALKLQKTLQTFGVPVTVNDISQGPSVTRYELSLGEGIKVNKIVSLTDDIKLNLAAEDIRIEAPIPGKAAVGIEVPNKVVGSVLVRDLLESGEFKNAKSNLTFAVGKDITGKTIVENIAKMPHLLIAGSTGSGKSVCINTLIMSLLYKAHPDDVKLIMIDPKVVELSVYNGIPHLCLPVVTEPKKASATLKWAVKEMDERYNDFAKYNVRDLKGYNDKAKALQDSKDPDAPELKPQIVIIVDELADLMMVASKEVEESICRLAQKARAAGIHLVIATQRPSVDVITGLIKANMPSRIAFKVSSGTDSRTILDMIGAERLLGKGDMLFYPQGFSKPQRIQGAFISDNEVSSVVEELKKQNMNYVVDDEISNQIDGLGQEEVSDNEDVNNTKGNDFDSYFKEACRFVVDKGSASSGMLQRVYRIGFNRAARMIDQMESIGVVSGEKGTKPRDILVNSVQLEEILSHI